MSDATPAHGSSCPAAQRGGGPLMNIARDEQRSAGERTIAEHLIGLFRQRQHLHAKRITLLPDTPLSFAQLKLLFHLPDTEPISVTAFARTAGMSAASASQALGALEQLELVERLRSSEDRRIVNVAMTSRGRDVMTEARTRFQRAWDELARRFTDDELLTCARVIDALAPVFTFGESVE